jgi:hypothetical protein
MGQVSSEKRFPRQRSSAVSGTRPGDAGFFAMAERNEHHAMGWHIVMESTPSLVACMIASSNHSFGLIRKNRQCVINPPTTALTDIVVAIGNTTGAKIDG